MPTTYTLATNYNGQHHSVSFYPAGYGASYDGYVTSLEQYESELKETYGVTSFKLMYINGSSELKEIEDSDDLFEAAEKLANGAHLSVTLIKDEDTEASDEDEWMVVESDAEELSDSESDEEEEAIYKYRNKTNATLKRFVNLEGHCHHCQRTDGLCFQYSKNTAYSMCEGCHDDLSKKERKSWTLAELPWEDTVPSYPLYREEGSPIRDEVCHLQYLLTRIGFMSLDHTDSLTGSFQSNTERAVEKFRREHNIYGEDMNVYNKKMARKLAKIVRSLRSEGHKYL